MHLPVDDSRESILTSVIDNPVTIIAGATGSGKTTRIPVFLHEAGIGERIVVTQPRRLAATSVAAYVAEQLGTALGDQVGYQIRFDNTSHRDTRIKFLTDGILLREIQKDPLLRKYDVVIVDEAHERSINTDLTLGLLRIALEQRDDMRVIVMSATLDEQRFANFFDAPIISIAGRTFPIDIMYAGRDFDEWAIEEGMRDEAIINRIRRIANIDEPGDILIFMSGEDEIKKLINRVNNLHLPIICLPAYGALPPHEQQKIFAQYPGQRKVVVATNIAETSLTISGIVHVIDSGEIKQKNFDPISGIDSLQRIPHSQTGMDQRAGRAGREQPGTCFRLCTRDNFLQRPKYTSPEILRSNLAGVVLTMKDIGIKDPAHFKLMDSPDSRAFTEAYETLQAMGAIDDNGLTQLGRDMAKLPLEPRIARMVLEAQHHHCVLDILTVAACMSVGKIFYLPTNPKKRELAIQEHLQFYDPLSDALTYLNVWEEYQDADGNSQWCAEKFLNARGLREIGEIRQQLIELLEEQGIPLETSDNTDDILRAVAAGLIYSLYHNDGYGYNPVFRPRVNAFIHPGSSVINSPQWVVAGQTTITSRVFMKFCSIVEPIWLPSLVPTRARMSVAMIKEWHPGDLQAIVKREVLWDDKSILEETVPIDLEGAIRVQAKAIARAEQEKLFPLQFRPATFVSRAYYQGQEYVSYEERLDPTAIYYCRKSINMGNEVSIAFRVYNFSTTQKPIPVVSPPSVTRLVLPPSTSYGVSNLANRWGGRMYSKRPKN